MSAIDEIEEALKEIAEGRGAYSYDKMRHAENCIDNAKALAGTCLSLLPRLREVVESARGYVEPPCFDIAKYQRMTAALAALEEGAEDGAR